MSCALELSTGVRAPGAATEMGNGESERAVQRSASYLAMALIYEIGARIPNCTFRSSRRWHLSLGPKKCRNSNKCLKVM